MMPLLPLGRLACLVGAWGVCKKWNGKHEFGALGLGSVEMWKDDRGGEVVCAGISHTAIKKESTKTHTLPPQPTHIHTGGRSSTLCCPGAAMARPSPEPHAYQPLAADANDATSSIAQRYYPSQQYIRSTTNVAGVNNLGSSSSSSSNASNAADGTSKGHHHHHHTTLNMHDPHDSISASQARCAGACYQGPLYKKRERCLGFCKPRWQPRFFVIVGRFLYRFASPDSNEAKGSPLALEGMDVRALEDEAMPYAFLISTLSKTVVVAAESADARVVWMHELRKAKQRAIKEGLGHAVEKKEHVALNKIGSRLMQRKWGRRAGEVPAAMVEMRALGAVGGYVDPHC